MISRRGFVLACAAGLLATAPACPALTAPPVAADPLALVNAVYARVARGKGDGGGAFIIESKAAKTKYLSKALVGLWAKADARTPKGDVGPVDFDPVTNSQEPDIKIVSGDRGEAGSREGGNRSHHHRPWPAARQTRR